MKSPVQVLIAESGSGWGGSAKYLSSLLPLLDAKRFSVRVVAYGNGPFIEEARRKGVPLQVRGGWRFPWGGRIWLAGFQLFLLLPAIVFFLRKRRIRLVHLNNEILSHIPLLLASRLAGAKIVCHLHGWRKLTWLEKMCTPAVDQFVAISEAGAKFFSAELDARKIAAVPNGLAINGELSHLETKRKAQRQLLKADPETFIFMLPGRLVPWKGQDVFLKALAAVIRDNPNVLGLVVGHDETPGEKYLAELKQQARVLGLRERVHFLAWQGDIWPLYAASDAVVHASTRPEPFGLVILEAMYASKPVIATKGGGAGDLVLDGVNGFLVEPNHSEALARAMARLISDQTEARRLAEAGEVRARMFFTMERNAATIEHIYEQVTGTEA